MFVGDKKYYGMFFQIRFGNGTHIYHFANWLWQNAIPDWTLLYNLFLFIVVEQGMADEQLDREFILLIATGIGLSTRST